jgi:hypothetical protein
VKSVRTPAVRGAALAVAAIVSFSTYGRTQEAQPAAATASPDTASTMRDLQAQVRQLQTIMEEMRAEYAQSRGDAPVAPGSPGHARSAGAPCCSY